MITRRWTAPWHEAPGLTKIYAPTVWAIVGPVIGNGIASMGFHDGNVLGIGAALVMWCAAMYGAWRVFRSAEGLRLALLSHLIFAGYIAGTIGAAGVIVALWGHVRNPSSVGWMVPVVFTIGIVGGATTLIGLGRRGEHYIAERCIRQYLDRRPA